MKRFASSGYAHVGTWKHVPVYFHWTLLLWLPPILLNVRSAVAVLMTMAALVGLLFLHELGHAIAAASRRTRVIAIRLFLMHGHCEHAYPNRETDHIVIAWGGVLAQLCLLGVALVCDVLAAHLWPDGRAMLDPLFRVFIDVNVFTVLLNLIPVSPLDGHVAWRILPLLRRRLARRVETRARARATPFNPESQQVLTAKWQQAAAGRPKPEGSPRIISCGDATFECAPRAWRDMHGFHLNGRAVSVSPDRDLVDIASRIVLDPERRMQECMSAGHVSRVTDEQALAWHKANAELLAVVIEPYVLVQPA